MHITPLLKKHSAILIIYAFLETVEYCTNEIMYSDSLKIVM